MFNLLLALITGLLIGWNFHSFFIKLNPPKILKSDINISKKTHKEISEKAVEDIPIMKESSIILMPKKEKITNKEVSQKDSFYIFLEKDLFSDAMAIYLDAQNKKLPLYRSTLINYFQVKSKIVPQESITQMLEFIELEPRHKAVSLELIKTYKSIKEYKEAINEISKLIENVPASELDSLHLELIEISQSYIEELNSSKNFQNLVSFLEERIELGIKTPFYTYSLAKYYVKLQEFSLATQLLKEIEYDYNYGNKAKKLLDLIEKKITQNKEYTHEIALKKVGEHFTIEVQLDNLPLTLLLDTGASLTMVNEEKLSSLTLIKENITLNTAGGEITAQLQEVDTFSVGEIELKKFQIVSSTFEQKDADGLLGMNFFKKFKFKIDQEKALLYLSEKEG